MLDKEEKAAMDMMQANAEKVMVGLLDKFKERFKADKVHVSGRTVNAVVRIDASIEAEDEKFAEIKKYFDELEEAIAYPEVSFIVRRIERPLDSAPEVK